MNKLQNHRSSLFGSLMFYLMACLTCLLCTSPSFNHHQEVLANPTTKPYHSKRNESLSGLESITTTTTILPPSYHHMTTSSLLTSQPMIKQNLYRFNEHPTDLYTVHPTTVSGQHNTNDNSDDDNHHPPTSHHQHQERQLKHDLVVYDYKCPKPHYIHPCDCLELDKRAEIFEGSGETVTDLAVNATPAVEVVDEEPVHPDLIETVAFCKNIRSVQVLTEAIRGFQGHRINFLVLDGCKLPPFPNNLFKGIHVVWMEIINSTMQFHDNFFQSKNCP